MDADLRQRISRAIVHARTARGWSQRELATTAGVSQSAVARAESGAGGTIEILERVMRVAGVQANLHEPPIEARDGSDVVHRTGLRALRRLLEREGRVVATEQPVAEGSFTGWIDLLGFDEAIARLLVTEFKSELHDLGATERQVERYARAALVPARAHGWRPREIVVALVVLATREADAFVWSNRAELAAAFPMRGRTATRAILDRGPIEGRALLALDPLRVGRRQLTSFRVDGRRRPFGLERASDLRRLLEERRRPRGRSGAR